MNSALQIVGALMRGAWWWVDRWRKSTAYTDMTLAEQGAYRNLLDELWLREGAIPNNERTLARACGDPLEWPSVREVVLSRFKLTAEGWVNDTQREVMAEAARRRELQRAKGKKRAEGAKRGPGGRFSSPAAPAEPPAGAPAGAPAERPPAHQPPSPSPSQEEEGAACPAPSRAAPSSDNPPSSSSDAKGTEWAERLRRQAAERQQEGESK